MYDCWDGKWDYSVDGNALTTTLEIGDNFAVNAEIRNLEGVDFWVVCCIKPMHTIRKEFIDKWGTSFAIGDNVVIGLYYATCGQKLLLELLNAALSFVQFFFSFVYNVRNHLHRCEMTLHKINK